MQDASAQGEILLYGCREKGREGRRRMVKDFFANATRRKGGGTQWWICFNFLRIVEIDALSFLWTFSLSHLCGTYFFERRKPDRIESAHPLPLIFFLFFFFQFFFPNHLIFSSSTSECCVINFMTSRFCIQTTAADESCKGIEASWHSEQGEARRLPRGGGVFDAGEMRMI